VSPSFFFILDQKNIFSEILKKISILNPYKLMKAQIKKVFKIEKQIVFRKNLENSVRFSDRLP